MIHAAIDAVRPAAEAKQIDIRTHVEAPDSIVRADTERLQQVLWNLLANAVKFTPAGGVVDVYLERHDSLAEIRIEDSGPGIPSDFLPRIFDRFSQADGSSTRKHGGLGLGLAIVRHLVELHGGTVSATQPQRWKWRSIDDASTADVRKVGATFRCCVLSTIRRVVPDGLKM